MTQVRKKFVYSFHPFGKNIFKNDLLRRKEPIEICILRYPETGFKSAEALIEALKQTVQEKDILYRIKFRIQPRV